MTRVSEVDLRDLDERLAKVAGQVDGIRHMVADQRRCTDVLDQLAAARAALDAIAAILVVDEVRGAVAEPAAAADLADAVSRLSRR